MLRKIAMLAVIVAVIAAAALWVISSPATIPASALASYAPNLDNGKIMFHAGGCATCHATPNQEDKTRLGGGFALKSPFGTFFPRTSRRTATMASAPGAKQTSSPPCGRAPHPAAATTIRFFPTPPTSA